MHKSVCYELGHAVTVFRIILQKLRFVNSSVSIFTLILFPVHITQEEFFLLGLLATLIRHENEENALHSRAI